MNREKQIEEMALDIHRVASFGLEMSTALAQDLYALDYRKASDLAREMFEEAIKLAKEIADNSAVLAELEENPIKRIEAKGEQIGALMVWEILMELKKKYTEESNVNNND